MDRDEILKRAQESEETDEMKSKVQLDSYRISYIAGLIICTALMIVKIVMDQPWTDVYAIFCGMMAVQNYYLWFKLHEKKTILVTAILYTITAVLLLVTYFLNIL